MVKIGTTEKGDAGLDFAWMNKNENFDGMILITKHLSYGFIEQAAKVNSIIHATITGHGGTIYEPKVPPLLISKQLFQKLIDKVGHERVVLRIDPIIPTDSGIAKAIYVYQQLHENIEKKTRVRISFMDNYEHVKQRFVKVGLKPLEYYFHAPIDLREKIASYFPDAEICGEPGMECVGCVSEKDLKILNIQEESKIGDYAIAAKSAQREECKCLTCKVEMLKNKIPCRGGCIYCYWK